MFGQIGRDDRMGGKEGESSSSRGQHKLRTRFHELAHQESEHTVSKSTGTCIDIVFDLCNWINL